MAALLPLRGSVGHHLSHPRLDRRSYPEGAVIYRLMDEVIPCRQAVHFAPRRAQHNLLVPLMPTNVLPPPPPPPPRPPVAPPPAPLCRPIAYFEGPPVMKQPAAPCFPFGRPKVASLPPETPQRARQLSDHELVHSLLSCQHSDQLFAACELRARGWAYNRVLLCWYRPTGRAPLERRPSHDILDVAFYEANHLGQVTGLKVVVNFRWVHEHFR